MKFDLLNYKKLLLEIQATYNKYKLNPDDNLLYDYLHSLLRQVNDLLESRTLLGDLYVKTNNMMLDMYRLMEYQRIKNHK